MFSGLSRLVIDGADEDAGALAEWITAVRSFDLPYVHSFTRGLDKDKAAVIAGLTQPYSNGPTEGHVNRIKMTKRQMYGRAGLDLLPQTRSPYQLRNITRSATEPLV
ncbi:transposase [Amycolatopsis sp. K13G38]|uniref:Transposase n=1 Tax=Amycolatopsis acididurans TaxID=2724524 RepID=A0ABX1JEL3_9PSEU|nr:transposase [Amycolatopsis acididurans]